MNGLLYTTNPTEDAISGTFYFYDDLHYLNDLDIKTCAPIIYSFSPSTVAAGTHYDGGPATNSMLTITGSGFGEQIGQVVFNGVKGQFAGTNESDIANNGWSNNEINVYVPHFVDSFPTPASMRTYPGSGYFIVKTQ